MGFNASTKHFTTGSFLSELNFNKNTIINGNFDIWQRGTSFTGVTSSDYNADRWKWFQSGAGVVDITQSTTVPDEQSEFSQLTTVSTADASIAAGDFYIVSYIAEGFDTQRFGFGDASAQQVTLSFKVRSSVTGTYAVTFSNGALDRSYPVEYTIDSANTWETKKITLTADVTGTWEKTTSAGLFIIFTLAAGSTFHGTNATWQAGNLVSTANQVNWMATTSNTFHLSRVQLEVGNEATDFERRPISIELDLCQRYYQEVGGVANVPFAQGLIVSSNGAWLTWEFIKEMRATPSISVSAAADFVLMHPAVGVDCDSVSFSNISTTKAFIAATVAGTPFAVGGGTMLRDDGTAAALVKVDAEL
jgi:hypothetical protein